jgi:hypothetical protein
MTEQERQLNREIAEEVFGWSGRVIRYEWPDRSKRERPIVTFLRYRDKYCHYPDMGGTPCVGEDGKRVPYSEHGAVPGAYCQHLSLAYVVEERIAELGLQGEYVEALARIVAAGTGGSVKLWLCLHASAADRCRAALECVRKKGRE